MVALGSFRLITEPGIPQNPDNGPKGGAEFHKGLQYQDSPDIAKQLRLPLTDTDAYYGLFNYKNGEIVKNEMQFGEPGIYWSVQRESDNFTNDRASILPNGTLYYQYNNDFLAKEESYDVPVEIDTENGPLTACKIEKTVSAKHPDGEYKVLATFSHNENQYRGFSPLVEGLALTLPEDGRRKICHTDAGQPAPSEAAVRDYLKQARQNPTNEQDIYNSAMLAVCEHYLHPQLTSKRAAQSELIPLVDEAIALNNENPFNNARIKATIQ